MSTSPFTFSIPLPKAIFAFLSRHVVLILFIILTSLSIANYVYYLHNGLGLAYNDARSHLDIGRRVVDNLKPGFAQLGSVWLPLPHLLMTLTVWNDFMWHSGLAGALESMISYIATGIIIYLFLEKFGINLLGRLTGVFVFALNTNILYMQSTAMTELLLLGTMTAGVYFLFLWYTDENIIQLIVAAFFIMLSTLIRYDGWFLFIFAIGLIAFHTFRKYGYKKAEGVVILFCTLGGLGILLWILWNLVIYKDPLYFIFGPYAAATQQDQLAHAGILATKKNLPFSIEMYLYAMFYIMTTVTVLLGAVGAVLLWLDSRISSQKRIFSILLIAPLVFNILALYLGQSVIFVQGLSGNSWFNVRYGLMMVPSIAIFIGYLTHRLKNIRYVLIGILLFVSLFAFINQDTVTIDDARFGASGTNVVEVSTWLHNHAGNAKGYVLISVASHDAIIFSSGLDMKRFIHEGTGAYWDLATTYPQRWVRWVVMRTYDKNDLTYKLLANDPTFNKYYYLVNHFPFADIYQLRPQYISQLQPLPVLANNE